MIDGVEPVSMLALFTCFYLNMEYIIGTCILYL